MEPYHIFISHFSQEEPLAKAIQEVVRTAFVGHARVFMSSDIPKGTNWLNEVRDHLLGCDEVLAIFSHRSAERPWLNIEIVTGASRMLEYLADQFENYRDHFTQHPDDLAQVENEPLRKYISSEHATNPADAPNPIILLGSLRRKGARDMFDEAIGRVPDVAIVVGGSLTGRLPEEVKLAHQSRVPVLPIAFTGGAAAKFDHTFNRRLNTKIEKLQNAGAKIDEFARLLIQVIYEQLDHNSVIEP